MVNDIIKTFNLTKKYSLKGHKKFVIALNNASINVKEGETFGLLGPNGAGKTTIISLLTTLLQPTSGYAIIDGYNIIKHPKRIRSKIGLVLGGSMNYYRITGYANLKFFCKIYGVEKYKEKIINISKEFELYRWLHEFVESYSTGMKVKLSICRIFLLKPKIIFLDEPTLGLDVLSTKFVINKLKSIDKTIFLTSHNMNVVEKLCNRIAFINKGKIEKIGNKDDIKKIYQSGIQINVEIIINQDKLKMELDQKDFIMNTVKINKGLKIYLRKREDFNKLLSILSNYSILTIREQKPSLEDLFLKFN